LRNPFGKRFDAATKKRPGFVCAKLSGNVKKNSVSSMEIWLAAPDSPYAALTCPHFVYHL
jgi:hypothetical protein